MAKKSFNISSTLSKNQEPKLAAKIPLKKKEKDVSEVAKKVAMIHQEEPQAPEVEEKIKPKEKAVAKKAKTPAAKSKTEKLVRLTIDTPEGMHRKLKIRSIERGLSMRDYILRLLEKELGKK